jgi:hypothetical protein
MAIVYTKTDQGLTVATGTGAPVHTAVAGDRYTDTANGNTYQYTTSWQSVSYSAGGLTYFTEAQNTTAPNATVPVDSLTALSATTNVDFAIIPKAGGALLAAIPDNTFAGGNKRGQFALDLQMSRSSAVMVASGNFSTILGGSNNTAIGASSLAAGLNNSVTGGNSVAIGQNNSSTNTNSYSFGNENLSNGLNSVAIGRFNNASGTSSVAIGGNISTYNLASGTRSVAIGEANTASGLNSTALGQLNISNGSYSFSFGRQAHTFGIDGRQAYASGQEGTSGDAQVSKFILHERTTGNTTTTITTNSSAAATNNQVILSDQSAYRFKGSIVGKQSGSVNAAVWDIDGFIVRGANATATTLNISNVNVVQNTPGWGTPTLAADTTNGGLRVQVTGATATNIQWTAVIDTTEVIYA